VGRVDILIYVPEQYRNEGHKKWDEDHAFCSKISYNPELDKDWEFYWFFGLSTPKNVIPGEDTVFFCDGKNIIAVGIIIDKDDEHIYFKSLIKMKYPQPIKAPTRGFIYLDMCN
jgi:hypothetical protein